MKLGGWQRIGVVLSLIWIALIIAYAFYEMHLGPFSSGLLTEVSASGPSVVKDGHTLTPVDTHFLWRRVALFALGPVVAFWTLFSGGALLVRWVAAGFKRNGT